VAERLAVLEAINDAIETATSPDDLRKLIPAPASERG
jgi:hypothetical protein